MIGGCVTVRDEENWKRLKLQQLTTGSAAVKLAYIYIFF